MLVLFSPLDLVFFAGGEHQGVGWRALAGPHGDLGKSVPGRAIGLAGVVCALGHHRRGALGDRVRLGTAGKRLGWWKLGDLVRERCLHVYWLHGGFLHVNVWIGSSTRSTGVERSTRVRCRRRAPAPVAAVIAIGRDHGADDVAAAGAAGGDATAKDPSRDFGDLAVA